MDSNGDGQVSVPELDQWVIADGANPIAYDAQISSRDRCRAAATLTLLLKFSVSPFQIAKSSPSLGGSHPIFTFKECD